MYAGYIRIAIKNQHSEEDRPVTTFILSAVILIELEGVSLFKKHRLQNRLKTKPGVNFI